MHFLFICKNEAVSNITRFFPQMIGEESQILLILSALYYGMTTEPEITRQ